MPSEPSNHIEQIFKKDIASLKDIFEFASTFVAANSLDDAMAFSIKFALEEVFTNMVKYNPLKHDVTISLTKEDRFVRMEFVDVEERPFDITAEGEVDTSLPMDRRKPGGLGIFLVKKMMDAVEYSHDGTRSRITLTKYLEH
jgi:serine/threonine-protein kinase RsbW